MSDHITKLLAKGVVIPRPESVFVSADVNVDLVESGSVLYPGSRIEGKMTCIGSGSRIGSEGPAVVINCRIGRKVNLGSGFFEASVFLDDASMGGGAHVRPGCLLEEQASGAHTVGLKQTVLMSYVTLGSLVNFCDCLMSGGTSRKNHSEVGSSYIHFNFTPHQDKATPSLIGDAVHGVLLDQPAIFLGGQGGLVGPTKLAFGTIIPAGQIIRSDALEPNHLVRGHQAVSGSRPYDAKIYGAVKRVFANNLEYIGNIRALHAWYEYIRYPFAGSNAIQQSCNKGAREALNLIVDERIRRLAELVEKLKISIDELGRKTDERSVAHLLEQQEIVSAWPAVKAGLESHDKAVDDHPDMKIVREHAVTAGRSMGYLEWIASMKQEVKTHAVQWLQTLVGVHCKLYH
ncbi:MAG TPA: hypothetical protein PJ991_11420 [Kiritimatiellia bacterium]|nr:hypothetical protein [Kiritimatiellia bacterium]